MCTIYVHVATCGSVCIMYYITPKVGVDFDTEARVMYTCTCMYINPYKCNTLLKV